MSDDETERYLEVHHSSQYGFGGNTTIRLLVTEETEYEIRGRRFSNQFGLGQEMTIRKDNVAGWQEYEPLNFPKSAEQVKEEYAKGGLSDEELEEELEDARL